MMASLVVPAPTLTSSLYSPGAMFPLPTGSILIAEAGSFSLLSPNQQVLKVVAGCGLSGYSDGHFMDSKVGTPRAIFSSPSGELYYCDKGNHCVRKMTKLGISTFAGIAKSGGFSGDGKHRLEAQFSGPTGGCFAPNGVYLYITDKENHRIRRITMSDGKVMSIGAGPRKSTDGSSTDACFNYPDWIRFVPSSNGSTIYIGEFSKVRILNTATNAVSTYCGTVLGYKDGPLLDCKFNEIRDGVFASNGDLYLCDSSNDVIRHVSVSNRLVTTLIGNGIGGSQLGMLKEAQLSFPMGLCWNLNGDLIIAEMDNHRIIKVAKLDPNPAAAISANYPFSAYFWLSGIEESLWKTSMEKELWTQRVQFVIKHPRSSSWQVKTLYTCNGVLPHTLCPVPGSQKIYCSASSTILEIDFSSSNPVVKSSPASDSGDLTGLAILPSDQSLIVVDYTKHQSYKFVNGKYHSKYFGTGHGGTSPIGTPRQESKCEWLSCVCIHPKKPLIYFGSLSGHISVVNTTTNKLEDVVGSGDVVTKDGPSSHCGFYGSSWLGFSPMAPYDLYIGSENCIRRVDSENYVSTYCGSESGYRDGHRITALFAGQLIGLFAPNGDLFVSDGRNCVIRCIIGDEVMTVAGVGIEGQLDSSADFARFRHPKGLCWHPNGRDMIVSDRVNRTIRVIEDVLRNESEIDDTANLIAVSIPSSFARDYDPHQQHQNQQPSSSSVPKSKDIQQWLLDLSNEKGDSSYMNYVQNFVSNGFQNLDQIVECALTESDLLQMGISVMLHRKMINKALQSLESAH